MSDPQRPHADDETLSASLVSSSPASLRRPAAGAARIAGRYELSAFLGQGGMGSVYRVHDVELDEVVALKFLRTEGIAEPGVLDRFRQEVKLARRVTHRNVARTFDIGEHEGERFLTMEYIDGEPLSSVLARAGSLPLRRAVQIGLELCAGLSAAHAAGIVHRDMKPDNVLLERTGRVVITDFGIARAQEEAAATGSIVGTVAYMAPEQVEGLADLDARADIYALGAVLYEMVTGEPPWKGPGVIAIAVARLSAPPPDPRATNPEVPERLAETIQRCMARRREDRFAAASEIAATLETTLTSIASNVDAPRPLTAMARALRVAPAPAVDDTTVAVLPFKNGGPPADDYLAEELAEDLNDVLCMARGLKVRPRALVLKHAAGLHDSFEIGRALNAHVIVEGSVRRGADTIRVSTRLISVAEELQLWAERFERPARDLLALNDDVARAVTRALTVGATPQPRRAAADTGVVDLYLRARHALRIAWHEGNVAEAVPLFERGLARAPDDPGLLSGYAMALARAFNFSSREADLDLRTARAAAERAIAVAPRSGEPWLALATLLHVTSEWPGAVRALRSALARAPGLVEAQGKLGIIDLELGRTEEALFRLEIVRSLDPSSTTACWELARCHAFMGRWDQAEPLLAIQADGDPSGLLSALIRTRLGLWRGGAYTVHPSPPGTGAPVTAAPAAVHASLSAYDQVWRTGTLPEDSLAVLGRTAEAARPRSRYRVILLQTLIELLAAAGDRARALATLERCLHAELFDLLWLDRCPLLQPLRGEPTFARVRASVEERVEPVLAAMSAPLE